MSHCTKFDFTYSDEEAIVKAFRKMGLQSSNELVATFNSDIAKKVFSRFGYMGTMQQRAICACKDDINMFMCKIAENQYELVCEHPAINTAIEKRMEELALEYQQAYVEVAVDMVVKKLENTGTPTRVEKDRGNYTINFGPSLEYKVAVSYDQNTIKEEVFGVKGSFCTALTEDIENILSHPETELVTEFKEEMEMVVEDQVLQVISLEF